MIHRRKIGAADVTVGRIASRLRNPDELSALYPDVPRDALDHALEQRGEVTWSFNLLIVSLDGSVLLVDTGFSFQDSTAGASTFELLNEAGVAAGDVDTVVITHGHGDHVGGLLHDGSPAFPGSELAVCGAELEFWTGDAAQRYGPEPAAAAAGAFAAYADRIRRLDHGDRILASPSGSVTAVGIPGHTPGHIGMLLESGGDSLRVLVDTLHAEFQLADLSWSPRFDVDPARAAVSRKTQVEAAARDNALVHLYHLPFPGFGRLREDGPAYRWVPDEE